MKNWFLALLFPMLCLQSYSQNKIARGYVLDAHTKAPIDSAIVAVYDTAIYTYTDVTGYFSIQTPKRRRHLDISHQEYEGKRIILGPGFQQRKTRIYLQSNQYLEQIAIHQLKSDSVFLSHKNTLSLSLIELLSVAIAIRYERFLSLRQSLGMHCSWYVYGFKFNLGSEYDLYANYNGFKAAPFYRFYPIRKASVGLFIEGKIPFGYFDFNEYEYHYYSNDNQKRSYAYSFWTWGFGVSIGVMRPLSRNGVISLSMGFQYFPMVEPPEYLYRQVTPETTLEYYTNTDWWYMPGPGSFYDLKLTIGGIF